MFEIFFYENEKGESPVWDFIEDLRKRKDKNKNANTEFNQIALYIDLLAKNGTRLSGNIVDHLQEDIWELRPGSNRILFFYYKDNKYVLLSCFRKKSQKTPKREIEKAIRLAKDFIRRFGK